MAFEKKFLKSRAACKARFKVGKDEAHGASKVFLVGDFNDWDTQANPMRPLKDGSFTIEIELPLGREFQFRYLTDDGTWFNDCKADAYQPCSFACDTNSIIRV